MKTEYCVVSLIRFVLYHEYMNTVCMRVVVCSLCHVPLLFAEYRNR